MKVTRRYNQYRRDLNIDLECEGCGTTQSVKRAYDDRNYWDNVVPNFSCPSCGKSTNSMNITLEYMPTAYPEGMQI